MKKFLSTLLVFVMVIGMLPMTIRASLPINNNKIDITDKQVGPYTLKYLEVYLQGSYTPVSIVSAEQNDTTIDIVLSTDTDPSAKLQAGLSGTGSGTLQHMGNTCTLENGAGTMTYEYRVTMGPQPVAGGSYTINFTTDGPSAPAVKFTTNLSETEEKYVQGRSAAPLTVSAKYVGGETENPIRYQWYKNTEKNTETGEAIDGATEESFTPATDEIGTTYYYAVASCENLAVTSKIATVTVEVPSLKILTNLSESQVNYIQGKSAVALTFDVEYTGITGNEVVYRWYKNTEKRTDGGELINGATDKSFTPATDEIGTTYYYVTAFCEGLTATSNVATITVTEIPVLDVADNVIDITDRTVYSRSSYYAKAVNIKISGANVEKATEDDTTVNIVLDGITSPSAEISVEFGTSLNRCTMSGHTGTVKLKNGEAQLVMTLKGQYISSLSGTCAYTLNFSLGEAPEVIPERMVEADSKETYNGVGITFDLNDYFRLAKYFYLVVNGEKTPLDNSIYTFKTNVGGTHTLVFAASNNTGNCPDLVTITIEVTEIKSGLWLGIATSNGSVNYVRFADEDGHEIQGLAASLEDNNIIVKLPRSYGTNKKITASFDLTQNESGLPKLSTTTDYRSSNDTKLYNTTLSNGMGKATMYLYNANSKATSNVYTTYSVNYAIENEIPTFAEDREENLAAEIIAGESFSLDLSPIFTDADGDELTYSVKINGGAAMPADKNYSFIPTLGGIYELEFFANDFMSTSAKSYKVSLTVTNSTVTYDMTVSLPDDITPAFYVTNGYDANGIDILGDILSSVKGDSANGYTAYTVSVPENISLISVRDDVYGGMAIPASSESTVKLQKVQTKIIDFGNKEITGTVSAIYDTHAAVGLEGKFLLLPQKGYSFTASPENTSAYNKATENVILADDTNAVSVKVSYKNPKTIITTTGATAKLFKYVSNYYVHTAIDPLATVDNDDGTSTHYFAADGNLSYRVSMDGKITKAGYLLSGNSARVIYTQEDALPSDRVDYSVAGTDASTVADDSVLLNINQQNHLSLTVGETKTLKAYRAWEIINNHLNHIIEPDFNFNIISGNDVVSLTPYDNQPMTNSSGNWRTLTAIGEGTAVIEVTYDATLIDGGSYSGLYGASDPARTGLFVVTVGSSAPAVDFGIKCKTGAGSIAYNDTNAKPWDSEFDTLYFLDETGEIKLSPTLAEGNITEVAISADKGKTYRMLEAADGVYTAPIVSGNNIIRVTTDIGIAYKIVRGDKLELSVKNITNPGNPLAPGDKISVTLIGVHTPIPKISGTFNPGYSGNNDGESKVHLRYSFGEETVLSQGRQYDFSLKGTTVEFILPSGSEETEFKLTDGYIGVGVIGVTGFSDDGDSHRNIPDSGSGTRDDKTTFTTRSLLPDIKVSIGMLPSGNIAPFIRETAPQTATLSLGGTYALSMSKVFTDRDGDEMTYTAKVEDGEAIIIDEYYTFTPDQTGTYTITFKAHDSSAESDAHTVTLTVKEKEITQKPSIEYDITGEDIKGYVNISFSDNGKRVKGEENVTYPKAIGTIIPTKQVPFTDGDTVADVTLRLLDALDYTYDYTGTTKNGFYLSSIGDFKVNGIGYDSFGEFDAGSGSGWMITLNKEFIEYGASKFEVKNGDIIKWQYTCQLGADIGDPFYRDISSSNNKTEDKEETKTDETKSPEKVLLEETTFTDIKKDDWHYNCVKYVYENNLMQGTGNGFEPDSKMSRAMLVTVLYRMANPESSKNTHSFADVPQGQWYSDAVAWAATNGIANGITGTEFAPESNVSREQMALIIYRFAKLQGYDISGKADISSFADTEDVSDWALEAICWANKTELVTGTSETTLSPKATATRAQVAAILMRFCENIAK